MSGCLRMFQQISPAYLYAATGINVVTFDWRGPGEMLTDFDAVIKALSSLSLWIGDDGQKRQQGSCWISP